MMVLSPAREYRTNESPLLHTRYKKKVNSSRIVLGKFRHIPVLARLEF